MSDLSGLSPFAAWWRTRAFPTIGPLRLTDWVPLLPLVRGKRAFIREWGWASLGSARRQIRTRLATGHGMRSLPYYYIMQPTPSWSRHLVPTQLAVNLSSHE